MSDHLLSRFVTCVSAQHAARLLWHAPVAWDHCARIPARRIACASGSFWRLQLDHSGAAGLSDQSNVTIRADTRIVIGDPALPCQSASTKRWTRPATT